MSADIERIAAAVARDYMTAGVSEDFAFGHPDTDDLTDDEVRQVMFEARVQLNELAGERVLVIHPTEEPTE